VADLVMPVGAVLTSVVVGYHDQSSAAIAAGLQTLSFNSGNYAGLGTSTWGTATISANVSTLPVGPTQRHVIVLEAPAHSLALQVTHVTYTYTVLD
jgi:hypothetical protein